MLCCTHLLSSITPWVSRCTLVDGHIFKQAFVKWHYRSLFFIEGFPQQLEPQYHNETNSKKIAHNHALPPCTQPLTSTRTKHIKHIFQPPPPLPPNPLPAFPPAVPVHTPPARPHARRANHNRQLAPEHERDEDQHCPGLPQD